MARLAQLSHGIILVTGANMVVAYHPNLVTWTDEVLLELEASTGRVFEVLNGFLKEKPVSGGTDGVINSNLIICLGEFCRRQNWGRVFDAQTQYHISDEFKPIPDVSFVGRMRLEAIGGVPEGLIPGPPDLAVETLSPHNRLTDAEDKAVRYLEHGCRLCWIIDPAHQEVRVFHSPTQPARVLKASDTLDGGNVLSGFCMSVSELFA